MKVVVAHNRYSSAQPSGENGVVAMEIDGLSRTEVTVIPFLRSSDDIPALPARQRAALAYSPAYGGRAVRELRALLRSERPDVMHLHNPYPLLSPWIVRTAHAYGVPVVHTLHNYRQTCVNGLHVRARGPESDCAACHDCRGRALNLPAVRHRCYRGSRAQSAVMAATLALHRRTWPTLDRVLALTPAMAEYARGLGVPADRIVVRPNAVPDPGPHAQDGDGFLFAGRLSAEKGVRLLLEAWDRHATGSLGTLRIAGAGPLAGLVRARAEVRADIEYLGQLGAHDVTTQMRRAAVVAVPSTWDEVCPTVALEALANARPVLGTTRGGLPWLTDGAGWTVDPTVEALAAALPAARAGAARLARPAREAYERRFTPDVALRSLIDVYRSVTVSETAQGTRSR
jgi:glycosyltransferase involved in cell wall biosynthesis